MASLKDRLTQIKDEKITRHEDVTVAEWDLVVRLKPMKGKDHSAFQTALGNALRKNGSIPETMIMDLLVKTMFDPETDERVFKTRADQAEGVKLLGEMDGAILNDLYEKSAKLSGISKDAEEQISEAEGN